MAQHYPSGTPFDPFRMEETASRFPATPPAPKAGGGAITGYRQLTEEEIALINRIKNEGIDLDALIEVTGKHLSEQADEALRRSRLGDTAETSRIDDAQPYKWVAIARTHFQQGLMALTRAVAQPRGF